MHICMPTLDHRVGVINSPRTSHSLLAVGMDAVAEAALPVALRVSRVSAIVAGSLNSFQSDGEKWMRTRLLQTSLSECVTWRGMSGRRTDRFVEIDENVLIGYIREKYRRSSLSERVTSLDSILSRVCLLARLFI